MKHTDPKTQALIEVAELILMRLDVEAKEKGEGATFVCAGHREPLRKALRDLGVVR